MSLTDTKVKNAKPSEKVVKLTDGFGLYLLVHPNGSKYWQLGYRFEGKQKVFSIGVYPAVSLADARQRRGDAKKLLAAGIDPSAKKRADNKSVQEKRNNTRAFKTVAKSWFATKTTWSEDYQRSVWTRLETYLFPDIGEKDIAELDTGDLMVPIKKIEKLGYLEIAIRVKQYATAIMRYAEMIRFNLRGVELITIFSVLNAAQRPLPVILRHSLFEVIASNPLLWSCVKDVSATNVKI